MEEITPGIYQNSKRPERFYMVFGISTHTETGEQTVTYLTLNGEITLHNKPLRNFLELVVLDEQRTHRNRLVSPIPDLLQRLANSINRSSLPK